MRHCCAGGCGRGFLRCRISTTSCRRLSPACCGHPYSPRTCEARFGQRNAGRISQRVMLITRGNWAGRWSSVHPRHSSRVAKHSVAKYRAALVHAAWRLERQGRFGWDFLPSYSPDLNPIECVWKRTRRNGLHNAYFPRLALVAESVEKQFARWSEPNPELTHLCPR